ncbi:hypothetical protein BDV36DRAFT_264328 [Aspergillus pseudocaelatus]|uniref:Uncharacterized protein n=1 Tax=Aspergillus pseudocaelatus TaxID=1825620 RepID=A0ABQ6WCJ7_9EURO|nr:hypothetical protein BDV36DRAFT_264328 [Aspergillus pseudocaelatus]
MDHATAPNDEETASHSQDEAENLKNDRESKLKEIQKELTSLQDSSSKTQERVPLAQITASVDAVNEIISDRSSDADRFLVDIKNCLRQLKSGCDSDIAISAQNLLKIITEIIKNTTQRVETSDNVVVEEQGQVTVVETIANIDVSTATKHEISARIRDVANQVKETRATSESPKPTHQLSQEAIESSAQARGPVFPPLNIPSANVLLDELSGHMIGGLLYIGDFACKDGVLLSSASFYPMTIGHSKLSASPSECPRGSEFRNAAPLVAYEERYDFVPRTYSLPLTQLPVDNWRVSSPTKLLELGKANNMTRSKNTLETETIIIQRQDHRVYSDASWSNYFSSKKYRLGVISNLFKVDTKIISDLSPGDRDIIMDHLTWVGPINKQRNLTVLKFKEADKTPQEEHHFLLRCTVLPLVALARKHEDEAAMLVISRPYPVIPELLKYQHEGLFPNEFLAKCLLGVLERLAAHGVSDRDNQFTACTGMDLFLRLMKRDLNNQKSTTENYSDAVKKATEMVLDNSTREIGYQRGLVLHARLLGLAFAAAAKYAMDKQLSDEAKKKRIVDSFRGIVALCLTVPVVTSGVAIPALVLIPPIVDLFATPAIESVVDRLLNKINWNNRCTAALETFKSNICSGNWGGETSLKIQFITVLDTTQKMAISAFQDYERDFDDGNRAKPGFLKRLQLAIRRKD